MTRRGRTGCDGTRIRQERHYWYDPTPEERRGPYDVLTCSCGVEWTRLVSDRRTERSIIVQED